MKKAAILKQFEGLSECNVFMKLIQRGTYQVISLEKPFYKSVPRTWYITLLLDTFQICNRIWEKRPVGEKQLLLYLLFTSSKDATIQLLR